MVLSGLDIIKRSFPSGLKGKRIGVLCHAPSISLDFIHITEFFSGRNDCQLTAIFGPQHGTFGQTQDNMIEWEGYMHPEFKIPVYSLYGNSRKPSPGMLSGIDVLVIDLQDVGARLYTYIWTVKLCLEACTDAGIPVYILDRPNPIGRIPFDGPVLKEEYFTFVGGASIPLCHRMTLGEMALWIRESYYPRCDLRIIWMEGWKRNSLFSETGLNWVLPSPNMPTQSSAMVYPGTVLIEALNISEGRGTTIPFELFGSPELKNIELKKELDKRNLQGCAFRIHDYIPTFHKFAGKLCYGIQVHITDPSKFFPVSVALDIFDAINKTSPGALMFNLPPYEYEEKLMPFDILSGDSRMRTVIETGSSLTVEKQRWRDEIEGFKRRFADISAYPED